MPWMNRGKDIIFNSSVGSAPSLLGEPPVSLLDDVVSIGLMKTTYTPDIKTDDQYADVSAQGLNATDYVAPGNVGSAQLTTKTLTRDDTNDRTEFDSDDLVFVGLGNGLNDTFDKILWCREQDAGATEANTEIIAWAAVGATTTNNGNITLVWNAQGQLHLG